MPVKVLVQTWNSYRISYSKLILTKICTSYLDTYILQTELGINYLYVKPELGLFYPAADYLTECIKKAHKKDPQKPIALDCYGILRIDYSAAKVRKIPKFETQN